MTQSQLLLIAAVVALVAWRVRRTRRLWAFVLVFIVLFPKVPLAAVPGNTTPLRVDDVVLGLVLGGWLVRRLARWDASVPASPITPHLVAYLGAALVSTLVGIAALTTDVGAGVFHFVRFVEYALLYYFFFSSVRPDELRDVLRLFTFTWLVVAGLWIVQHWTAVAGMNDRFGNWDTLAPTFSATYDFGGYVMMATLICYAAWVHGHVRGFATTAGLFLGLYIALNGDSRAAFVGLVAAIALDVLLKARLRVALALFAIGAALPFLLHSQKMVRLIGVLTSWNPGTVARAFMEDPSMAYRLENWNAALERWIERPVLGDGLGAYLRYVKIYDLPGSPDGWYVRVLAETGLLGLLTFTLLIGSFLWVLLTAARSETRPMVRGFLHGGALVVFGLCINAFFIDVFVSFKMMGVFWMLMAVATRVTAERATGGEWLVAPIETVHA